MNNAEKTRQKEALNEAMGQILDKDNPHAYSTIAKVGHHLWQFGLFSYIEPAEILTEAYLRALRAIDQGTQIQNYRGWIRGTAFNIVRERFRQAGNEFSTDPQAGCFDRLSEPDYCCEDQCDRNFTILREAFEKLRVTEPDVAELMNWRIVEELSWTDIEQRLLKRDGKSPSIEALRQRATRAKRKLRRLFHELGGEYEPLRS